MKSAFQLVLFIGFTWSSLQLLKQNSNDLSTDDDSCKFPAVPPHGDYTSPQCKEEENRTLPQCRSGGLAPHLWLLEYTCHPGYRLPRNLEVYYTRCFDGVWAPTPPVCLDEKVASYIEKVAAPKATSKPIPGGCLLPHHPIHGRYFTFSCTAGATPRPPGCDSVPGTPVPADWTLTYTCDQGYQKQFSAARLGQYARCTNGSWDVKPPVCIKMCPGLESTTHEFRCFHGASEVSCGTDVLPGTVATYRCHDFWTRDSGDPTKLLSCTSDGSWTHQPPPCTPVCGSSEIDSSHPRIIDGEPSHLGYFPWHAGVYHRAAGGQGWDQFCGGTLIRPNVILTAAFCVVTEGQDRTVTLMDPRDLQIALGKYYRNWDEMEPTEVKRKVKEVKVPSNYKGSSTNFEFDIALLLLDQEVPISRAVMPVCLEASGTTQPTNNMLGYITGWGNSEMVRPSETVLYCSWPIQDYETCFNNIVRKKEGGYISADKFCAGVEVRAAARKSVGGSFSIVANKKHYISGILSSQVVRRDEIDYLKDINYPVFTNISHQSHKQWIAATISQWVNGF